MLSKSTDGSFEVQVRQERVANRNNLSLNTAVAMNVCGHRVALYVRPLPNSGDGSVWIDGAPVLIRDGAIPLDNGGEVQRLGGDDYGVIWPSGDQVRVNTITVSGSQFFNIMPLLRPDHREEMIGLLGNFNRTTRDDLMGRDGTVVPAQSTYSLASNTLDRALPAVIPVGQIEDAYFDSLYRQFGDSWRVRSPESLFDYLPGQTTASFTDLDFPSQAFTLNGVAPVQVRSALNSCQAAGVEEALLDGCVFDVAATGDSGFTNAAVNAVANAITRRLGDRLVDEIRDAIPIPRFPF
ncbi:hypothetical protein C7271_15095 [filamentous cyanobacterium CCP5]|nr:hypothetical protein C7271_15095 [filamentous cyanobacterium CCP5]